MTHTQHDLQKKNLDALRLINETEEQSESSSEAAAAAESPKNGALVTCFGCFFY